jgi:hypothetical protein
MSIPGLSIYFFTTGKGWLMYEYDDSLAHATEN